MMRSRFAEVLLVVGLGCDPQTADPNRDLAASQGRADTAPLVVPPIRGQGFLLGCSFPWPAATPARVVVDLRLRAESTGRQVMDSAVKAIEAMGGRVLYRFQVPVVRAELDTAAVRRLVNGPERIAQYARTVPDSTRRDVQLQVFYNGTVAEVNERALLEAGAIGIGYRRGRPIRYVLAPDSVIGRIAALPGVQRVYALSAGCASRTRSERSGSSRVGRGAQGGVRMRPPSNVALQLTSDIKEYRARFARCDACDGSLAAELWR